MKDPVTVSYFKGPSGTIRFGKIYVKAGEFRVQTFVYHEGIHWDEVASELVLREFGFRFFP